MRADVLIVGQGLAGTVLAWELERAGISFSIVDSGHDHSATLAAAGILNPITGRRLVKSWRYEQLFPAAQAFYRDIERELGVSLWQPMRLRRIFADERERELAKDARRVRELAEFIEAADETGWWVRHAARVDLASLLAASRTRWKSSGALREESCDEPHELTRHGLVIDCRGVSATTAAEFSFVPWEFSKGELLELQIDELEPDVILNRRHWIVPIGLGRAFVGATHQPGVRHPQPSAEGRTTLEAAARDLLGPARTFSVVTHRAGVRVTLADKRPLAGRHPVDARLGLVNALAAKGALWAPLLAREWVRHLKTGAAFDPDIDLARFTKR
jgi:glycine oxidase